MGNSIKVIHDSNKINLLLTVFQLSRKFTYQISQGKMYTKNSSPFMAADSLQRLPCKMTFMSLC